MQVQELLRPDFAKRIRTTAAQRSEMCKVMSEPDAYRNEKVWTMLVADLLAHSTDQQALVRLLCGCDVDVAAPIDIWFEVQPIPSR